LFRLIEREFKNNGWFETQTPQLEGTGLNTELFGVKKGKLRITFAGLYFYNCKQNWPSLE
jgi:hypothetical protein